MPESAALPESVWGSAVVRRIPLRRALNFWRLRQNREDGITITYYSTKRGIVVLAVESPRGEGEQ